MADTIRELLVKIGVDADDKGLDQFDQALGDLVDLAAQAVIAMTAAAIAVGAFISTAIDASSATVEGAQRTALATEAYQELRYAAQQSGVGVEQFTAAMSRQVRVAGEAIESTNGYIEVNDDLKIKVTDANGVMLDQETLLYTVAEAVQNAASEQEGLAIATAVYGEAGAKMLPMLQQGGEGMEGMAAQARALGLVMSEEGLQAAEAFGDSIDTIWMILSAVQQQIVIGLLPVLQQLIDRLMAWYAANQDLIQQGIDKTIDLILAGINALVRWVGAADEVVTRVFGGWEPIFAAVGVAVGAIAAAIAALAALKAWIAIQGVMAAIGTIGAVAFAKLAAIIALVVGVIVGLGLVIDDLIVYFQGGNSAIGTFMQENMKAEGIMGSLARVFDAFMQLLPVLWDWIVRIGEVWWAVFSVTALPVLMILGRILMWIANEAVASLAAGLDMLAIVINGITSALLFFGNMADKVLDPILSKLSAVAAYMGMEIDAAADSADAVQADSIAASNAYGAQAALDSAAGTASAQEMYGAPTGAPGGGGSTTSLTQGDLNLSVTGVGLGEEDVQKLIDEALERRDRDAAAALSGIEV